MRNIHELIGIIKGINFDGVINAAETEELKLWLVKNRNLTYDNSQRTLVDLLEKILEDGVIDDSEREKIVSVASEYTEADIVSDSSLYELNGIVRGIVCDEVINKDEIKNLRKWLKNNKDNGSSKEYTKLFDKINKILADNFVSKSEREELLNELKRMLDKSEFESKLNNLRNLAKQKKNFGIELIDIIDEEEVIDYIHTRAEKNLTKLLLSYSGTIAGTKEDIFISLVLIALLNYDSNFYDYVEETYKNVYDGTFPFQRIEGTIRSVISRYRNKNIPQDNSRIINTVLKQAIVPQHYLPAFFEFIYDIYKLNFEFELPEDLYDEFDYILNGLKGSMDANNDDLKLDVTKKTYKLIKSTKMLIIENDYDGLIKLSIIVVRLIDKFYWDLPLNVVNPYLKYGFETWSEIQQKEQKTPERIKNDFRSKWEPKYYLDGNKILLLTPIHKIKAEYDFSKIFVEILRDGGFIDIYIDSSVDSTKQYEEEYIYFTDKVNEYISENKMVPIYATFYLVDGETLERVRNYYLSDIDFDSYFQNDVRGNVPEMSACFVKTAPAFVSKEEYTKRRADFENGK